MSIGNSNSGNNVDRRSSIRYISEDDERFLLTFNSLDRGELNEDFPKSNSFMYNSEEDLYRFNSIKYPRDVERVNSNNLEKIVETTENSYNQFKDNLQSQDNSNFGNIIKEKKVFILYVIMFCYLIFCFIELFFGYFVNSLVLMADAAHYFSESTCFGIYIIIIYIYKKTPINNTKLGLDIIEVIGYLVRSSFLLGLSFWIFYYSIKRFIHYQYTKGLPVIIFGIISILVNITIELIIIFLGIKNNISSSEKEKKQNRASDNSIENSFKNVIIDSLPKCIIIIAGVLIYCLPSILYIDPSCSIFLCLLLLLKGFIHFGKVVKILMRMNYEFGEGELKNDLMNIQGIIGVYDIQLWSLNNGKKSMSCNLISLDPENSFKFATEMLSKKYNIPYSTIKVESNKGKINKN